MIDYEAFTRICHRLDQMVDEMIALELALTAIPAIAPENGGDGEWEKASFLKEFISSLGVGTIGEINAPDARVSAGVRPNIIVTTHGKPDGITKWVVTHTDVVPPGARAFWKGIPSAVGWKMAGCMAAVRRIINRTWWPRSLPLRHVLTKGRRCPIG